MRLFLSEKVRLRILVSCNVGILVIASVAVAAGSSGRSRWSPERAQQISDTLALATFDTVWTRVRDSHYDSLMNGVNWIAVRDSLRPRASRIRNTTELRTLLRDMLSQLGTSHYTIIPRERAPLWRRDGESAPLPGDVGVEFRARGDSAQVFVSRVDSASPAHAAGIRAGWRVIQAGGFYPAQLHGSIGNCSSCHGDAPSNEQGPAARSARLTEMRYTLQALNATRGDPGTPITIDLVDESGATRNFALTRRQTPGEVVRMPNLPPVAARVSWEKISGPRGCVGVLRFNTWMPLIAPRIDAAVDSLRSCRGMMMDLRGNTGGVLNMVVGVSGHFLSTRDTLATIKARRSQSTLVANPRVSNARGDRVTPFAGPLAILVDDFTGSTSEVFAGALQSLGRARVFGERTSGQALPATTHDLPNHDILLYVVADMRGPKGERWEGVGVTPDVILPLTVSDLLHDAPDHAREQAIAWINSSGILTRWGTHE